MNRLAIVVLSSKWTLMICNYQRADICKYWSEVEIWKFRKMQKKVHKVDLFPKMKFHCDPIAIFDNPRVPYFERSSRHLDSLSRASMTGLENISFRIPAVHNFINLYYLVSRCVLYANVHVRFWEIGRIIFRKGICSVVTWPCILLFCIVSTT